MAFLFNRSARPRSPSEVARTAKDLLSRLWDSPSSPKLEDDIAKQLSQMKLITQGTPEMDSTPALVRSLFDSVIREDLLFELAHSIHKLSFEARKDTQTIVTHILRYKPNDNPGDPPAINYIVHQRPEVIIELCRGFDDPQSALSCASILKEAVKFDVIAALILYDQSAEHEAAVRLKDINAEQPQSGDGIFWRFFEWIDRGSFEVSADAFTIFRDLLTRHKTLVATYLTTNYNLFFGRYHNILIQSDSYVTKRQSIKLLGEILLDRTNYNVMTAYVDSGEHLKACMTLLRDDRKMVQYEGFHVFKVFVANPNKSVAVQRILINNRERLLKFLPKFLEDRTDDDQFTDEKAFLVRQIELLPNEHATTSRSNVNAAAV
ncbi:conidiophore development protein HymA [Talaromyces proteolyticus]|uniref:Conidiophore development protein HymA n=1 Tax=Talaromyces proteolyticus TaxID=1131652 RepID=A0AAD4KLT1_9EURO|nr:conidiophore development protein HymA [Talaromyces proteolyticus]KAH8695524.1 conidiophore development protein HymA [Talaromyces proteolyticus]